MTRFAIIGAARSGTNLLVDLLNSHPDVECHGEIFSHRGVRTLRRASRVRRLLGTEDLDTSRNVDPLAFLDAVWRASPAGITTGFKMFANDFPIVQEALARTPEIRLIVLERPNKLAIFSSMEIGKATQIWHTSEPSETLPEIRLDFDGAAFQRFVEGQETIYRRLRERLNVRAACPETVLQLAYPKLTSPGIGDRLCAFLGIARQPLFSRLRKQNNPRAAERFRDPAAVAAFVEGMGHAAWAAEG